MQVHLCSVHNATVGRQWEKQIVDWAQFCTGFYEIFFGNAMILGDGNGMVTQSIVLLPMLLGLEDAPAKSAGFL